MICLSNSDISAFVSLSFFFLPQTVMVMGDSKEGVAYSSWCIGESYGAGSVIRTRNIFCFW